MYPYLTYNDYISLYPDEMKGVQFDRLTWEASAILDWHTTTVDGVSKLRDAFPTDEFDKMAVIRCLARLVNVLYEIEKLTQKANSEQTMIQEPDGTIHSAKVSTRSSGAESVSYADASRVNLVLQVPEIEKAATDHAYRDQYLGDIVRKSLVNVRDANGVNLLYQGVYPHV